MLVSTADGKSLNALGEMLGFPKLVLGRAPDGRPWIEQMSSLLDYDPNLFEAYALRDAEICAKYLRVLWELSRNLGLGDGPPPPTLPSMAARVAENGLKAMQYDRLQVLGRHVVKRQAYGGNRGSTTTRPSIKGYLTKTNPEYIDQTAAIFAKHCYHGGRNEASYYGLTVPMRVGLWFERDLTSAYVLPMAAGWRIPDFERIKGTTNPTAYQADTLGFATVSFEFPSDVRPSLPVLCEKYNSLFFPRKGVTGVTSVEIAAARAVGAKLEIVNGCMIPWLDDRRPFLDIMRGAVEKRKEAKESNEVQAANFWKIFNLSMYGLTLQGELDKKAWSPESDTRQLIGQSRLSSIFIGAYITGWVRAVMGLLANRCPHGELASITTDSLMTRTDLPKSPGGDLVLNAFADMSEAVLGHRDFLGFKSMARQIYQFRTRGNVTVRGLKVAKKGPDGFKLAKGGIQTPAGMPDHLANSWLWDLIANREPGTMIEHKGSVPLPLQVRESWFFDRESETRRLSVECDFKGSPRFEEAYICPDSDLIGCPIEPWDTIDEALRERERFARWVQPGKRQTGHCVKSPEDAFDWLLYSARHGSARALDQMESLGIADVVEHLPLRRYG
jgi:hypothetical protein